MPTVPEPSASTFVSSPYWTVQPVRRTPSATSAARTATDTAAGFLFFKGVSRFDSVMLPRSFLGGETATWSTTASLHHLGR